MLHKIVIASDSFKGSATSREVADAAARAVGQILPDCEVRKVVIADGGEGTVDALVAGTDGRYACARVHDPLMRPVEARYGLIGGGRTAVVEMAAASGLTLLSPDERNPMLTTTYGTGELIRHALEGGCRDFLIGIGGSATNDGGMGMMRALGVRFADASGRELAGAGQDLMSVCAIDVSGLLPELGNARFTVACDVDNPYYGPEGAAQVFARQKGADDAAVRRLDRGLENLEGLIRRTTGIGLQDVAGSGAGGAAAGALAAFLSGRIVPGIDMLLDAVGFDEIIKGAGLIITGEGRMDSQTARGKAPGGVLRYAGRQGIPVIALAGSIGDGFDDGGFAAVMPILNAPVSLECAMDKEFTLRNIERTVCRILKIAGICGGKA